MAGQFCFCGELRRGVDGDAGEQGAVEDASFGWVALVVEVVEEFGEPVQACSGRGVGVGDVAMPVSFREPVHRVEEPTRCPAVGQS